jgi:hypothetical protein
LNFPAGQELQPLWSALTACPLGHVAHESPAAANFPAAHGVSYDEPSQENPAVQIEHAS